MTFSIITPSYGQLEWLRMCVASVADQNQPLKQGISKLEDGSLGADENAAQRIHDGTQSPISNLHILLSNLQMHNPNVYRILLNIILIIIKILYI